MASEINAQVAALAAKIKASLTVDTQGAGAAEDGLYNTLLPEGLTPDVVESVSNYNTDFIAAGTFAFGELAVETMRANAGLNEAAVEIRMGVADTLKVAVEREHTWKNPGATDGSTTTKYGVITNGYEVKSGRNGGQLKVARNQIAAMAMELLK
jgi:hypothetical protein